MLPANESPRRDEFASVSDMRTMTARFRSSARSAFVVLALAATATALASCGSVRGTDRRLLEQNPAPTELAEDAARR
jgi:hypothetical protein